MNNKIRGILSLLIATIIWGSAFIAQSVGMDYIGPMTFLAVRCGMGAAFLIPLSYLFENDKSAFVANWMNPKLWKTGFICGLALFTASGMQQVGLVYTTAGKAGFITAMYIILVPILGIFLGNHPSPMAWVSVGLAVGGLYLLSCVGVSSVNIGDLLLLGCAMAYAVQITLVDRMVDDLDGIRLNFVQVLVCGVASTIAMLLTEEPNFADIYACFMPIAYAGFFSTGIAFTLQIIGQKYLEPTPASLIMSLESVIAVLCGWLLLHERMSKYEISGCILVFIAVILSQVPAKKSHD